MICRKVRPKMTFAVFMQIFVLGLLGYLLMKNAAASIFSNRFEKISCLCGFLCCVFSSCSAVLRPVIDQNLYYAGLKFTSPTFSCAMSNMLPAMTFVMAVLCRYRATNRYAKHSIIDFILS